MPLADHPAQQSVLARILIFLVLVYRRFISPAIPPSCRFTPSCSAYALEALQRHGAVRGTWLTIRRLLRCGPWHRGGYDPVPQRGTPASHSSDGHRPERSSSPSGALHC